MTTSTQSADLVRLSVLAGERMVDLVLPSRLPLAEILPEVVALSGSLDAYEAYGGYTLVGTDGRALDLDASFLAQGVHDGAILTLVTGAEAEEKKVYDDVVEAVADSVEDLGAGWTEQHARLTTLGVSGLLLVLGALALLLNRGSGVVVLVVAAVATVLLLLSGAVFARVRRDETTAVVVLVGAGLYAVAAGLGVGAAGSGPPVLAAGLGLAVVGGASMLLLPARRWAFLPFLVLGFAGAAIGAVLMGTSLGAGRVVAIVTVVAVILGSVIPWFALASTRTMVAPLQSEAEIVAEPEPVDLARIRRGIGLAHDLVLGLSMSVSLIVLLGAPALVGLGWAGLGVVWAAGLVQMMRTRQFLLARDVAVGLAGGSVGVAAGTVAALVQHPEWGLVVGALVGVSAVGVLASLALPAAATVRRGRILDVVEGLLLFAMVPLLVLALGLISSIRG